MHAAHVCIKVVSMSDTEVESAMLNQQCLTFKPNVWLTLFQRSSQHCSNVEELAEIIPLDQINKFRIF